MSDCLFVSLRSEIKRKSILKILYQTHINYQRPHNSIIVNVFFPHIIAISPCDADYHRAVLVLVLARDTRVSPPFDGGGVAAGVRHRECY